MQRLLAAACVALCFLASPAAAAPDPIGELLQRLDAIKDAVLRAPDWLMKATVYHTGSKGVGSRDSMGCRLSPMRTLAVDPHMVPRGTVVFIKETVGLPMPDGSTHDGLWYASDIGGAIKGERIDLFTGQGARSMKPVMDLNLRSLSVTKVASFEGCPPLA